MGYDQRDRLIVAQVAAKAAVELRTAGDQTSITDLAQSVQKLIFNLAAQDLTLQAAVPSHSQQPVAVPLQAPVTVPVPGAPPAPPAPAPAPMVQPGPVSPAEMIAAAAASAQTGLSHQSPAEVLWADALQNAPQDWYDNRNDQRASMNGGKGPDFRHKTLKKGQYNLGLWVKSGDTPGWVVAHLTNYQG